MADLAEQQTITTRNVHKLTTFELRKELERRKEMDIPSNEINYKSLLNRMIRILVREEEQKANEEASKHQEVQKKIIEEKRKEREQKKKEAMERSLQRQAQLNYFGDKKAPLVIKESNDVVQEICESEEEEISLSQEENCDIFSTNFKAKVFVK